MAHVYPRGRPPSKPRTAHPFPVTAAPFPTTHCEMEPVGLAVGIAGLAGLFTTCIECFNIVQQKRYFGRDY
jgi:hypothetical protein